MNDQTTNSAETTKRKLRFGRFAQAMALLAAIVLLGGATFFTWYSFSTKRLKAATTALEKAGFAGSATDLKEAYEKPVDGTNPAGLWLKAGQEFEKYDPAYAKMPYIGGEGSELPTQGEPWDQYETSKAYVAKHADAFAMMEQAAATKTPARFTDEVVRAFTTDESSWMTGHRAMARAVQERCTLHAYEGNLSEVIRDIRLGLAIGKSLQHEWSTLRSMISLACTQMALGQIGEHLHLDFTDDQLQRLQATLREFDPRQSLLKCAEGETLRGVAGFQDPRQVGPLPRHDDAAFLAEQGLLVLNSVKTRDWVEIAKASEKLREVRNELERHPQPEYMMSALWLPSMQNSIDAHVDTAAKLLVHDALVATKRFQLMNGRLPLSLEELVPDFLPTLPIDSWSPDGSPLVFRAVEKKVTIYSIGHDRIDDGGDSSEAASGREKDVVAVLHTTIESTP